MGNWNPNDELNFEKCEKELDVADLIGFRLAALEEINSDFKHVLKKFHIIFSFILFQ